MNMGVQKTVEIMKNLYFHSTSILTVQNINSKYITTKEMKSVY
jgi:hypothetical protein